MSRPYALVIRGGTVVDGSGGEPRDADVGIADGRVAAVGPNLAAGDEEIDARGKIVTPGFIDPHTHYDAQATWSSQITPSSWNGVTTAMMGNCGVGFAPCRPDQRDTLVEFMEGVEDIPGAVLDEGLPWTWQSFEQFMDALDARPYDLDIAAQVPHSPVRVFVMGQRGVEREPATPEDNAAMAELAAAGIRAGALGFSTSRTLNHKTLDGRPIPTLTAAEDELTAIGLAMGSVGAGWLQVISDFVDLDEEFAMLRRVVERCRRPLAITILQVDRAPDGWRRILDHIAAANRDGLPIIGQTLTRATGVLLGFEISINPFSGRPSWEAIAHLPLAEKLKTLRQPAFRARLFAEECANASLARRVSSWDRLYPLGTPPNYEPSDEQSVAAIAAREGKTPEDVAYDYLLERDGKAMLYRPVSNYSEGSLDAVGEMLRHPNTLVSLGDGGAHVGMLCDASAFSYMLIHWVRDRAVGERMSLPWAVRRMTRDNALALGLEDRGLLQPGYKADLNVIDYDKLTLHCPEPVYDLPAGGRRLIQRAEGYVATVVSGAPVYRDGEATGALPGRLLRGPQPGPQAGAAA
ncbi:MAG: amidohydrolase family protein [Rhodospirillales bacterium]|nr:amidohydrolase family protein [Rhodospirillales bacterium]